MLGVPNFSKTNIKRKYTNLNNNISNDIGITKKCKQLNLKEELTNEKNKFKELEQQMFSYF